MLGGAFTYMLSSEIPTFIVAGHETTRYIPQTFCSRNLQILILGIVLQ